MEFYAPASRGPPHLPSKGKIAFARRAISWVSLGCRSTALGAAELLGARESTPCHAIRKESIREQITKTFFGSAGSRSI